MIILPEDKSSFAYAGGQAGQALSNAFNQQFQQRFQNQRLANALGDLRGQNYDPLQAMQRLTEAGASESQLAAFLPLIQQSIRNKALMNQAQQAGAGGLPSTPVKAETGTPGIATEVPEATRKAPQKPILQKFISPELEQIVSNPYIPMTQQQILARANQLSQQQPGLPIDDYIKMAEKEEARNAAAYEGKAKEYQTLSTMANSLNNGIEEKTKDRVSALGKADLNDEASGNYLANLKEKYEDIVSRKKMSIPQAVEAASKEFKNYADKRLQINTQLSSWMPFKGLVNYLEDASKHFKDPEEKNTLKNDFISKGKMSVGLASQLAWPIEGKTKKWLESKRNVGITELMKKTKGKSIPGLSQLENQNEKSREIAREYSKMVNPNDNFVSIGKELENKGYNGIEFLREMNNLKSENLLQNLTDEQEKQLIETSSFTPSWGDIWIEIF